MSVTLNWPAKVPLPTFAGYQFKPKPNLRRTEMDVGTARQRRSSRQKIDDINVTLELTAWEMMIFEAWVFEEALEGAAWFNVNLQGGIGIALCEARIKGGADMIYTARNGVRWNVRMTLELRNRPKLSAADLALLESVDGDAWLAAINAMNQWITTTDMWAS